MTQDWATFLADQGLAADHGAFGDVVEELAAARDGAVVAPITDQGLIRASGADAAEFLHNLLTNDIRGITAGNARLAGLCTAKGRLLALFLVWRDGEDFLLLLPREILPAILKKLSMYVLRAKVKLSDASEERVLLGIANQDGAEPIAGRGLAGLPPRGATSVDGGQGIRLDGKRWLLAVTSDQAMALWQTCRAAARPVGLAAWNWLEIAQGQARVLAATQEAFVPQMLNLELPAVAGVSFTKGCYPGQEIVARTQYLGKVKRRTFRARLAGAVAPGAHVFSAETGDQHCGAIVSLAPSPDGGHECLVCVQIGARESGDVRVGSLDGEGLEFLSLPYSVSDDEPAAA